MKHLPATFLLVVLAAAPFALLARDPPKRLAPVPDWSRQSVFLIGADANVDGVVFAFPGKVKDGRFHSSLFTPVRMNQLALDGYYVGVAKGEEQVAPSSFRWTAAPGVSGEYRFCEDDSVPVLSAKPGQIVYLGDLHVRVGQFDHSFRFQFDQDAEAARQWVAAHYPGEESRFVVSGFVRMPPADKCKK